MKEQKKIDINLLKQQQFSKYSSLDIPKNILKENFEKVKNIQDESEIIFHFDRRIGKYIVNEIKNDNIDLTIMIIDKYNYLKKLIVKNPKYNLQPNEINKIYEDAIELLKNRYNDKELLSSNIVDNMKYIILSNNKHNLCEEKMYDISFFKEYIELYGIESRAYANILSYSMKSFNQILLGTKKIEKDDLDILCGLFNVSSYDELKNIIEEKIQFYKYKEELLKKRNELKKHIKPKEEIKEESKESNEIIISNKIIDKDGITRYNLSFIKEYADLYNLSIKQLSTKLHCGVGKVDDILNGKLLIKETIIDEIAYEFNANNFDDLYNKIINAINTKKYNINNKLKELKK